ncbi:Ff.00g090270.m01.CDS01 [Fusarium sp. VM40]|nr:Ff.00g090270.m01.CDS01 [Fusarium sp. VM40]
MATRPADKAGTWYDDDAKKLEAQLKGFLAAVPESVDGVSLPVTGARIVIAPHAGYSYSGRCAAWAYKSLDLSKAKRVFVLGPSHTYYLEGCAAATFGKYATPFGDLTVDTETVRDIKEAGYMEDMPRTSEVDEHSLEMHMPYLYLRCEQTFGSPDKFPTIVPLLIGSNNGSEEKAYAKVLLPYFKDPDNAFIISSDFCHWGRNFSYQVYSPSNSPSDLIRLRSSDAAPIDPPIHETIRIIDEAAMDAVKSGSHDSFLASLRQTKNTVCGRHPIGVTLAALELLKKEPGFEDKCRFSIMQYNRSNMVELPNEMSVSYVSAYGRQNPYDSPDQGYGGQGGYSDNTGYGNGGGYNSPPAAQGYGGSVEMAPLAHNASGFGQDPNAILNECRDIDRGIDTVEQNLEQLRMIQQRTLDDADSSGSSAASRQLDSLSADTMSLYRELTERVRTVKSSPEASSAKNNPHVTRIDRRLKAAITQYQQVESQFRKRTQDQMARQYRIVRPDASEQEIQAAVEDTTGGQVFSQAMMQSDRQGRARAALSAVQDRHQALVKIEQQMVELSQLFQDMDTLVVQQEAAVTQIEQKGEEVVENLDKGNEEIGVAVNTARKTRKKKWICLGICVAIIVVIVIIVLIYIFVIKGQNNSDNKRRSIEAVAGSLPIMHTAVLPARLARRVAADNSASALLNSLGGGRFHLPQLPQN